MRFSRGGLVAGALVGLSLALWGAVGGRLPRFASDVLVRVSGVPIRRSDVDAALARLGRDAAADPAARSAALEGLVDEALLAQRAQETGLTESDGTVRKAMIRAVIDTETARASAAPQGDAVLRAFHAENAALFATPRLVRARTIRFSDPASPAAARARAERARAAIEGGLPFEEAALRFGDAVPTPGALVPEAVLRRQLGPALASAALALAAGEVSAPVEAQGGAYLVELAEDRPGRAAAFDEVRGAVQAELARRRGDDALRALRARLRGRARIVLSPDAPRP